MRPHRRWFQYSLRSFLILVTALAVWLGIVVNRAREQREAVKAIEALGGEVVYDWKLELDREEPLGPRWLRELIGDDFFQEVRHVYLFPVPTGSAIRSEIPHLQRLRKLNTVWSWYQVSDAQYREMKTALPRCEILTVKPDL
jgi:hypothetical protein